LDVDDLRVTMVEESKHGKDIFVRKFKLEVRLSPLAIKLVFVVT